ncbi:MAG: hypothetical protein LBE02_02055 [Spirochaetaceae bacterium]|jgi:hypothetical protein|nr:hypothetical protein [Spirochaetaceae bacterium]
MKKLLFLMVWVGVARIGFAQPEPIVFKVSSYQISRRQTANLYARAELFINDEELTWEIILYRKDNTGPEHIKLEQFDLPGNNGIFRTVTIQETSGTSGSNLFAYLLYEGNKIRIDLCDVRTERVRRRLIIEY